MKVSAAEYRRRLELHLAKPGVTPAADELLTRTLDPRDRPTSGDEDVARVFPTLPAVAAICDDEDIAHRMLCGVAAAELKRGERLPVLLSAEPAGSFDTPFPRLAVADLTPLLEGGEDLLIMIEAVRAGEDAVSVIDLRARFSESAMCVACDRAMALAIRDVGFRVMPVTGGEVEGDGGPGLQRAGGSAATTRSSASLPDLLTGRDEFVANVGIAPVTVSAYAPFVEDGGYRDDRWWGEFAEAAGRWTRPREWSRQLESPTRPVTGVSWYEASAFAAYRSTISGEAIGVASFAARRAVCAEPFPWGTDAPSPSFLNYDQFVGETSPVGTYVRGRGPYGHFDLAGNVWEWCSDRPDRESAVVCGGGWYTTADYVTSAYQYKFHCGNRFNDLGFRLARAEVVP